MIDSDKNVTLRGTVEGLWRVKEKRGWWDGGVCWWRGEGLIKCGVGRLVLIVVERRHLVII